MKLFTDAGSAIKVEIALEEPSAITTMVKNDPQKNPQELAPGILASASVTTPTESDISCDGQNSRKWKPSTLWS